MIFVLAVMFGLADQTSAQGIDVREDWVKNLTVTNGAQWGEWTEPEFCPYGEYAIGYSMKMHDYQLFGDDTAMNGLKLLCTGEHMNTTITSGFGHRGEWTPRVTCHQEYGQLMYLRAFALQVEEHQHNLDDTAANFIKFKCGLADETVPLEDLALDPGHGPWGEFGDWSEICDQDTAICGLQTKIQSDQGEDDDTTLNDVILFCCEEKVYEFLGDNLEHSIGK